MSPRERVLKIRNSKEHYRLRHICQNLIIKNVPGRSHQEINKLVFQIDTMVEQARGEVEQDQIAEFEQELWKEMKCYCLLSDLCKGMGFSLKCCQNANCPC